MPQKVAVQALRDIALYPPLKEGERREFSPTDARALLALGWVKHINKPGRPRQETK
jgi:hypothetical protein